MYGIGSFVSCCDCFIDDGSICVGNVGGDFVGEFIEYFKIGVWCLRLVGEVIWVGGGEYVVGFGVN